MPFFSFSIVTPKNTPKEKKLKTPLTLSPGVIHQVNVYNWRGNRGVVHLVIEHEHHQIFPLGKNEDFHGDGLEISFKEFNELKKGHAVLDAYTWNDSTLYEHEWIVQFGILPRWVLLPITALQKIHAEIMKLGTGWKEI